MDTLSGTPMESGTHAVESHETDAIIRFCNDEVERQRDTGDPYAVFGLIDAWMYSIQWYDTLRNSYDNPPLSHDFIKTIGRMAKPMVNHSGYRMYPIRIGYSVIEHYNIASQMSGLIDAYNDGRLNPQELYLEYESIHPFGDGNGRTGKILFNWANGTLRSPVMPENPYGWAIP